MQLNRQQAQQSAVNGAEILSSNLGVLRTAWLAYAAV